MKVRESGGGEPWTSAQTTLEKYSTLLRSTKSVEDTGRVCEQYAPILKQVAMRLPKSQVPQIMGKASVGTVLPHGAPAMAKRLMLSLHPACLAEVLLAPDDLKASSQQLSWLVGAETVAVEVAELLRGAPDWRIVQKTDWLIAESMERLNAFLHSLASILLFITGQLSNITKQKEALRDHCRFLMEISLQIAGNADLMQAMLGHEDPIYSPSIRLEESSRKLWNAAKGLYEKLMVILKQIDWEFEDLGTGQMAGDKKLKRPVVRRDAARSIIGMLATGDKSMMSPEEYQRRHAVDEKLRLRRLKGSSVPSDDEQPPEASRGKRNPPLENSPLQQHRDRQAAAGRGGGRSGWRGKQQQLADLDDTMDVQSTKSEEFDAHDGQSPSKGQLAPQFLGSNYVDSGSEDFDVPPQDSRRKPARG